MKIEGRKTLQTETDARSNSITYTHTEYLMRIHISFYYVFSFVRCCLSWEANNIGKYLQWDERVSGWLLCVRV